MPTAARRDRRVARGALHVPDEAAEDRRHGRRRPQFVTVPKLPLDRAGGDPLGAGVVTAAEHKAEGLAD